MLNKSELKAIVKNLTKKYNWILNNPSTESEMNKFIANSVRSYYNLIQKIDMSEYVRYALNILLNIPGLTGNLKMTDIPNFRHQMSILVKYANGEQVTTPWFTILSENIFSLIPALQGELKRLLALPYGSDGNTPAQVLSIELIIQTVLIKDNKLELMISREILEQLKHWKFTFTHLQQLTYNLTKEDGKWYIGSTPISERYRHNRFRTRTIGNITYVFDGLTLQYLYMERRLSGLRSMTNNKPHKTISAYITMDIETYLDSDNKHCIQSIGWSNGQTANTFYITDYKNDIDMFKWLLQSIWGASDKKQIIYMHNLGGFDSAFIVSLFARLGHEFSKIIRKDGSIININIKHPNYPKRTFEIKDSYLILPLSLAKLCTTFNIESPKTYFPWKLISSDTLSYVGPIKDMPNYHKLTADDKRKLEVYYPSHWIDVKEDNLKYLTIDTLSLHQVLAVFQNNMMNQFGIDPIKTFSAPSLSYKIFKLNVAKFNLIPSADKKLDTAARLCFRGGLNQIYRPYYKGDCYIYDVNSLYPHMMQSQMMPTGNPVYTTNTNLDELFGISYAEVESPQNMHKPFLMAPIQGTTTITLGTWLGWYTTEELKYAKTLGYKIRVLESYVYKPRNIFSDIIAQYNTLKQSPDTGLRQIGKLLMNSLFGKFAQKPILSYSFIIPEDQLLALKDEIKLYDEGIHTPMTTYELENFNAKKRTITQEEKIGDSDLYLITIKGGKDTIGQVEDRRSTTKTQSAIPIISAFISAYARVFLHQNIMKFDPLYVDTDSLVVRKPLPMDIVDPKKLGLFKLEKQGIEFIALNLKRYALKRIDGEEVNKMSGSKHPLSFDQYLALYAKLSPEYIPPTIAILQERSYLNYPQGTIETRMVNTTFEFDHNSRLALYEFSRWIDTYPHYYNNIMDIESELLAGEIGKYLIGLDQYYHSIATTTIDGYGAHVDNRQ